MQEYVKFLARFGKVKGSAKAFSSRFSTFKKKFRQIKEHNSNPNRSFNMEVNEFSDISEEEFFADFVGGLKHPSMHMKEASNMFLAADDVKLEASPTVYDVPEEVDWVAKGVVSTPYAQGPCGACWAFSTASTLESLAMINGFKSANESEPLEFSVQQLVDCDEESNQGCGGGWMTDAYKYTRDNGIELKDSYPYQYRKVEMWCKHAENRTFF